MYNPSGCVGELEVKLETLLASALEVPFGYKAHQRSNFCSDKSLLSYLLQI
jgi:hypothetical protein